MHILNSWMLSQLLRFQIFITATEEVVFSPMSDGWFARFFQQDYTKTTEQIHQKLGCVLVWIQIRGQIQVCFLLSLKL